MKSTKLIYIIIFCAIAFTTKSCMADINLATKTIKGNGTLTTKEISIDDYDRIEVAGSVELNYQQLEQQPYLQVTIDENLLEYVDIYVKNRILHIQPAKNESRMNTYNINPTKFTINTNSKQIRSINLAGSGNINLLSDIHTDILEFDLAGSGKVFSEKTINVGTLDIDLAGSGNVSLQGKAQTCNIDLAGSGTVFLKGNAEICKIDIAGSGKILSSNLSVKHLRCDVAGSGKVEIDVIESIRCDIAGSGTITYTGNPSSIKKDIAGSGKLIKK